MAEKLVATVVSFGPATAPLTRVDAYWTVTDTLWAGSPVFYVDMNGPVSSCRDTIAALIAADAAAVTAKPYTAADIVGRDEFLGQQYGMVPVSVAFPSTLLVADDLARVPIPSILNHPNVKIDSVPWSLSARALLSGTATIVVKNNAGTVLASRAITAAGTYTFTPTVSTINAGDTLRFGMTGLGLGLSDVSVTAWLRVPLGV